MKEQSETITKDEWLLRRVHKEYVDLGRLAPAGFKPIGAKGKNPDRRGISLYRQSCLQCANDVFQNTENEKKTNYGIASVSVEFLFRCGLGVLPDDDAIPGHVLIPEINCVDYESSKDRKD